MDTDRESTLRRLRALKPRFGELNIRRMAVFGSVARGEARPDSDLDLLVEFIDTPGFFGFIETKDKLADLLGQPVDLVTFRALKSPRQKKILEESIDV